MGEVIDGDIGKPQTQRSPGAGQYQALGQ
jgi:hypothetical protein